MGTGYKLTEQMNHRAKEITKKLAAEVESKIGTSVDSIKLYCEAGLHIVEHMKAEAEKQISANNERYSVKVAEELNSPIQNALKEEIKTIKEMLQLNTNKQIDSRLRQISSFVTKPISEDNKRDFETLKLRMDYGEKMPTEELQLWGEKFAGNYQAENIFAGMVKKYGITYIPSINIDKSRDNLEQLRLMATRAINHIDNVNSDLIALSFFNNNSDSPFAELCRSIDSDIASIIPVERLTVLERLNDAQRKAYAKDDVRLSVDIDSFIRRNRTELANPAGMDASLYNEAENLIQQSENAKKNTK